MKERPILFSTDMVQALLDGRKTQTRRIVKKRYSNTDLVMKEFHSGKTKKLVELQNDTPEPVKLENGNIRYSLKAFAEVKCPYGQPGDLLYVRETWKPSPCTWKEYSYKVDYNDALADLVRWKPSIHMPKDASRIFLQVKEVKVERLQDISEEDAKAEGVKLHERGVKWLNYTDEKAGLTQFIYNRPSAKHSFRTLWELINGPVSWQANPWVWGVKFEVISTTGRAAAYAKLGKEVPA